MDKWDEIVTEGIRRKCHIMDILGRLLLVGQQQRQEYRVNQAKFIQQKSLAQ